MLGGSWRWNHEQFGFKAGISVYHPTAPVEQFQALDTQLDDGNLNTGYFRSHANGYIYVMEF